MPSTQTITSFYTFTANTKARSSQVNTNFSIFRGHIIPVDPNTQTAAATNTYDLGSSDYRWRSTYTKALDIMSNTTTGNEIKIYGETSGSSPAAIYSVGGTSTASGKHSFLVRSSEKCAIDEYGLYNNFSVTSDGSNPGIGGIVFSPGSNSFQTTITSGVVITGTTITLSVSGRPLKISMIPASTSSGSRLQLSSFGNIGDKTAHIRLCRDTTTSIIASSVFDFNPGTTGSQNFTFTLPGCLYYDLQTAGTYQYFAMVNFSGTGGTFTLSNYKMVAEERRA